MKKYLFIFLGSVSLVLGLCGLFTPGLPTTPFILLTGALYTKSSPRLYKKLESNRLTGMYLKRMETGLSWKARLFSISLMWCMVCITAFLVFDGEGKMRYIMLGLGVVGTVAQLIALRKKKPKLETINLEQEEVDLERKDQV
jgi:uncharacterized membrane protein YbaN (DUF454 family)